jgi:NAD(P)-dependent dehydrogenase (short-subunit alcohol dehydrogenase family)
LLAEALRAARVGVRVLDVGTGTGALALEAALSGAAEVIAATTVPARSSPRGSTRGYGGCPYRCSVAIYSRPWPGRCSMSSSPIRRMSVRTALPAREVRHTCGTVVRPDVLHHGTQTPVEDIREITTDQLERTFHVNVHSLVWTVQEALEHMPDDGSIVVTGSINGLRGNKTLIDYSASKAAAMNLAQSMAQVLSDRGIRVNCVAPGPVWTPLIPATFDADRVEGFGEQSPMGRAAEPDEIAPSYIFFASNRLSSYYTGQNLVPAGGEIHPG